MISIASSIRFRKDDNLSASFDNTQYNDEAFRGSFTHRFRQSFYSTDTVTIQVKVADGLTVAGSYSTNCWGAWVALPAATLKTDGATYDYYEIAIDFSTLAMDTVQFKVELSDGETWLSEPVEILTDTDASLLQVEFFNIENAFEVDYGTTISHLLRIPGQLKEYKPGGEMSVFDNQDETTKIKDEVKRILTFRTEPIPRYLAEMLRVAVAHDKFFINEVEFVADSLPEFENNSSGVGTFSVNLIQRNVIGLNTHDVGFDCDTITISDTMVLQEEEASGSVSFTVPEGYLIAYISGYRTAGDPLVVAGTTPGGTDILYGMSLNNTDNKFETAMIGREIDIDDDATLYVTVSGAGATATVIVLLINNRQT